MKLNISYSAASQNILYSVLPEAENDGFSNFKLLAHDLEVLEACIDSEHEESIMFKVPTDWTNAQKCILTVYKACTKSHSLEGLI